MIELSWTRRSEAANPSFAEHALPSLIFLITSQEACLRLKFWQISRISTMKTFEQLLLLQPTVSAASLLRHDPIIR